MGVIALARWGLTMHVHEDTLIWNLPQDLGITVDQQGTRESVFDWVSTSNPDLTLKERIRRRLEIHETGVRLGYAMPNNKKELLTLLSIAKQTHKKIFKIHQS